MAYLNKVFLIGNLTRDPELRVTQKGTPICSFSLAVNRQFRDEGGAQREEVTYVDIEAWGKQGELASKYLTKGSPCLVEGRLRLDSWEGRDGAKRSKLKVILENVQFLGRKSDGTPTELRDRPQSSEERESTFQPPPPRTVGSCATSPRSLPEPPPVDDDVPF